MCARALRELAEALGDRIVDIELPAPFGRAHEWHRAINYADLAKNYARYYDRDQSLLSERLRVMIEEGMDDPRRRLQSRARRHGRAERRAGEAVRALRRDPDARRPRRGAARLEATGDPAFSTLWTYCGVPALTLPLLTGSNGMPIGVQLVGRRFYDGRLLRTARWLSETVRRDGTGHPRHHGRGGMSSLDRDSRASLASRLRRLPRHPDLVRAEAGAGRRLRRLRRALRLRFRPQHLHPPLARAQLPARGGALGAAAPADPPLSYSTMSGFGPT